MPATTVVATPAPVVEYIAPAPAVSYVAPAPVVEYIAPAPAVYAAPAPVVEYIAPAPAVYAAPAPGGVHCASTCSVRRACTNRGIRCSSASSNHTDLVSSTCHEGVAADNRARWQNGDLWAGRARLPWDGPSSGWRRGTGGHGTATNRGRGSDSRS